MKITLQQRQNEESLTNYFVEKKTSQLQRRLSADDVINTKKSDISIASVPDNNLLSEQMNVVLLEQEDISQAEKQDSQAINKKILLASTILGIGTGFAMMPIFNYEVRELENYGINIHQYESAFIISTINTLLVTTTCSIISLYHYFNNSSNYNLDNLPKYQQIGSKICSVASSILPISLLWNIELHDQKVDKSEGFDKFIAWASFCTVPLLIFKTIEAYETICKVAKGTYKSIDLNSIGSKLITYGTCVLSALARGISFSSAITELAINIGLDQDTANILGILIGGILGSVSSAFIEYPAVKSLFKKYDTPITGKEIMTGIFSGIEGMWFGLPAVSVGLNATTNWNPLLRGIMFVPLFISRTSLEATSMYKTLNHKQGYIVNNIV